MEAVSIQGTDFLPRMRRLSFIVAVVCSINAVPAAQSSAKAAIYKPSTSAELVAAFKSAGSNAQDDIVDLGGQTFELASELILKPDEGHSFELRDGTLERSDESVPFRLLRLVEVPDRFEAYSAPVYIEGVQFKNGLYLDEDLAGSGNAGGGALLANRKTIISNARFVNNRFLGNGSGGAIKHSKLLEISDALFINNQAIATSNFQLAQGGAIAADDGARLFVGHGYFQSNDADRGGAIYASSKVVDLNITRSAFNDNQVKTNGGAIWSDVGKGGVRISNTSFIANRAPLGGGALYTQARQADITMFHVTMWGNKSDAGQGAGIRALAPGRGSRLSLRNSVIANNAGGNCSGVQVDGLSIKLSSHNVSDDGTCGSLGVNIITDTESVYDGKFSYHGGSIPTMPVAESSPVRNIVPRADCLSFDSRGLRRLDNAYLPDEYCDAGAFEFIPQEFIDLDNDGVGNHADNCLRVSNPLQSDIDEDGVGDQCDTRDDRDSDGDVVLNFQDNCPSVINFLQFDSNRNGIGDACEQATVRLTLAPVFR